MTENKGIGRPTTTTCNTKLGRAEASLSGPYGGGTTGNKPSEISEGKPEEVPRRITGLAVQQASSTSRSSISQEQEEGNEKT